MDPIKVRTIDVNTEKLSRRLMQKGADELNKKSLYVHKRGLVQAEQQARADLVLAPPEYDEDDDGRSY
ncbi:MAG: hypothetical protein ABJO67_16770 [Pseudoruegeria sp.]